MSRKLSALLIAVLAAAGIALWYTPLKILSLLWLWMLIGLPTRELFASPVETRSASENASFF